MCALSVTITAPSTGDILTNPPLVMSRISKHLAQAFSRLNADLGKPKLSYGGSDYVCIPHQSDQSDDLGAGGLSPNYDIAFVVDASAFATAPTSKGFITFEGKEYQIERVKKSPCGSHYKLECMDPDRAA